MRLTRPKVCGGSQYILEKSAIQNNRTEVTLEMFSRSYADLRGEVLVGTNTGILGQRASECEAQGVTIPLHR